MIHIEYATENDKTFWYSLDKHLLQTEFPKKVRDKQGYVIFDGEKPIGILRYNLFWDNLPICTMLYIETPSQRKGYGRKIMEYRENDMKKCGHGMVLTSTQVDESAQHFYRKLGYKD